ncbi:MAG: penicillin-binding protein activator [Patescibacteria group bacterium]
MNKKTITIIVIIVILGGIFWWSNAKKQDIPDTSAGEKIKIGVLALLSGEGAAWGESAKRGIDMAVEEYKNINPDAIVEVIYEDTGGDTKKAVAGLQKFISLDNVDAVIGPLLQTEVAAVAPIIAEKNIPVVTPSYAPAPNRPNLKNPLSLWLDGTVESERMAAYVATQGIKTIGVIGTKDGWESEVSNAFAKKVQELGISVVGLEIVQPDVADMRLSVTKIISQKPDAIFIGTGFQFINSVTALSQLQYKGKLYSIEVDSYFAEQTADKIDSMQFIAPDFYSSDFMKKFEQKYSVRPGIPAGQAYDSANLLLSVLEKSDNPQEAIESFSKMTSYQGVSGNIQFMPDGKTFLPTALFDLKKGEISRVVELK